MTHATPLPAIPVFYDPRMVAEAESFSPSAGKPRAVVASWQAMHAPLVLQAPIPVTREQLARAHARDYVDGVLDGRRRNGFGNTLPEVAASLPWTSGAMLCAASRQPATAKAPVRSGATTRRDRTCAARSRGCRWRSAPGSRAAAAGSPRRSWPPAANSGPEGHTRSGVHRTSWCR